MHSALRLRDMPRSASSSLLTNLPARSLHTTAINCKKQPFKGPLDYSKPRQEHKTAAKGIPTWRKDSESQGQGSGWLGPSSSGVRTETKPKRWLDQPVEFPKRVKPAAPARSLDSGASNGYAQYKQSYTDPSLSRVSRATRQTTTEPWMPTKKLSLSAMAGLKALHEADPEKFSRTELAERFGISYEAVRRITKSKFRESDDDALDARSTKWDLNPVSGEALSPVPALKRAFERAGREIKPKASGGLGAKPSITGAPRSRGGFGLRKEQEAPSGPAAPTVDVESHERSR